MVLISSKKYACETCIKGHRSSACKHTDRPLFEIKKKGRPVTQCEHCRELRKTKQVHVKCICEAKEPPSPKDPNKKKGTPTIPAQAAFPNGLPNAGSVSAALSDSDPGGSTTQKASACSCKLTGGECHCCIPRNTIPRRRSEPPPPTAINKSTATISKSPVVPSTPNPTPNPSPNPNPNPNATNEGPVASGSRSHHILARLAELRPVLPRLSARDAALMQGAAGQHDLFHHSPGHGHHHGEHFSPYGRAYEHATSGYVDYSSDASTGSVGFYQQDARSVESLLSISSFASVPSASQRQKSQKSHSQKSPSYDGSTQSTFLRGAEVEWRLPPSLSRSNNNNGDVFPSYDSNQNPNSNGRPRSEGGYSQSLAPLDDSVFVPRATTTSQPFGGVRTCGCGDGCACIGCAMHDGQSSSRNKRATKCADPAQCAGACLDCTILSFNQDFGDASGAGNGNDDGYTRDLELGDHDFEQMNIGFGDVKMHGEELPVEQQQAIDDWIREVMPVPVDFEHHPFGIDPSAANLSPNTAHNDNLAFDNNSNPINPPVKVEFQDMGLAGMDFDASWVFDAGAQSGSMLSVPGPAHGRSRSSSSASSEADGLVSVNGVPQTLGIEMPMGGIPNPLEPVMSRPGGGHGFTNTLSTSSAYMGMDVDDGIFFFPPHASSSRPHA